VKLLTLKGAGPGLFEDAQARRDHGAGDQPTSQTTLFNEMR
jgi:hypothetical protein